MLKDNRALIASAAVLALVVIAALAYASPTRFGAQVVAAAKNHDTLRLQQLIDFPAVSESLKADLKPLADQALAQRLAQGGASGQGGAGARIAAAAQAVLDLGVDQLADQLATPAALENLVDDKPVQVIAAGRAATPVDDVFPKDRAGVRFRVSHRYLAFDRFRYTLTGVSGHSSVDIDLVRHNLFGWRVERVGANIDLADIQGPDLPAPADSSAEPPPPPPPPSGEAPVASQAAASAPDDGLPTQVGQCVTTTVKEVSSRLQDTPGSGSAVAFANGGRQVSYDQVEAVDESQPGDAVRMCLVEVPADCPPSDNRGSVYRTTNLRTGASWTLPDSEHACGGA